MERRRHVPLRTCVGCRQVRPKRQLIRIVRLPDGGVEVDPTGKRSGRGAYLCPQRDCWVKALERKGLDHALKTTLSDQEKVYLLEFGRSFGETDEGETR